MKPDYDDYNYNAEPGEDYYEYLQRKKGEAASISLAFMVLKLIFFTITAIIVYSPLFYLGYLAAMKVSPTPDRVADYKIVGWTIFFGYVLYALVFFLKGLLVGLKAKGNTIWTLLWLICVIATCFIPAFLAMSFLSTMFRPSERTTAFAQLVSWSGGLLFGLYVYYRYKFKTHHAPKIVAWSYKLGLTLVR